MSSVEPARDHAKLLRFTVFNNAFGPREGEEDKKVIFYHSEAGDGEDDAHEKNRHVGLAAACTTFAQIFFGKDGADCKIMQTQKVAGMPPCSFQPSVVHYPSVCFRPRRPSFSQKRTSG